MLPAIGIVKCHGDFTILLRPVDRVQDTVQHVGLVVRSVAELEASVAVESHLVGHATAGLVFLSVGMVVGEGDDLGVVPDPDGRGTDACGAGVVVFGHFWQDGL